MIDWRGRPARASVGSACAALLLLLSTQLALPQDVSAARPAVLPLAGEAEGASIESLVVNLRRSSGDPLRDREALGQARRITARMERNDYSWIQTQRAIAQMLRQDSIAAAEFRLLAGSQRSAVRLAFDIDAAQAAKPPQPITSGMLLGDISAFPVLYKDERSLLTAIVGAGFGGYGDLNAWFGNPELFNANNPLAGHLPGKSTAWAEGYAELGIGGATQLWDSPYYAFGALTGLFSWSLGQDIFRDDPRGFLDFEKAYAGLLYVDPENRKNNLKLSVGRQSYTLNDGFLINAVKGSTNAGDRGGLYLGPRLTNDFLVLAEGNSGAWGYNLFYIDPNELEQLESDTTFLGANLKYRFSDDFSADASLITIPTSKSTYANPYGLRLEREGLYTIAGHGLWNNAFTLPGIWLEAAAAHQSHPDFAMSAWAYYGTVGYIAKDKPWTPSLSYRYAYFSGDDPDTPRYERFDPLLSTGLGVWLQGVSFGKITSNSNLETQRVQFNVAPNEMLNLTLDYYWLRAPELNNLGSNPALATLTSQDLGQEVALSARWTASKRLYVQALASYAMPGAALRNIGAGDAWTTFQLSLYGGF
jgi:hypothetical protein